MWQVIIALMFMSELVFAKMPDMTYVVETTIIKPRAQFLVVRRYIGTIKAEKFSLLSPKVIGTVASIEVKPGQKVKKGQLLISLTSDVEKRALELAGKNLKLSRAGLKRSRSLFKSEDITKSKLEESERDLLHALVKLEEQKRQVENLEIRAPFDGVVGVPRVVMGESVQPSSSIISVMDGPFSVFINIPSSRLSEVKVGQLVKIKSMNTTISAVERSIDPVTRTGFAKVMLPSCENCIIGDSVYATISVHEKTNAILITNNAVYYKNQKPYVVVVIKDEQGNAKAQIREIAIGEEQQGEVLIESGLKDDDEIVIANPKRIPDQANLSVLK